jgi:hypothetical protein
VIGIDGIVTAARTATHRPANAWNGRLRSV